jgi:hypothetical protein
MLWVLPYIVFCFLLAVLNANVIAKGKRVYHALNGLAHALVWLACWYFTRDWWLVAALPFIGRVVFDTSLNSLRGLPLDYVAQKPKSIIDQIEKKVFGKNGILPKVIYLLIATTLIIISYATHGKL